MRGMVSPLTKKRREERNARVAAVKALNLQPGDWVVTGGKGGVRQVNSAMLDARSYQFQWLRRATQEEIDKVKAHHAEMALRAKKAEEHRKRPEISNANAILCYSAEELVEALGAEFIAEIVARLDAK